MTPINAGGTTISGGTSLIATDSSLNKLFQQNSSGYVFKPTNSSGSTLLPLFNVGWSSEGWITFNSPTWTVNTIPFRYTGGSGYFNVGNCYNTGTYAFTAPWTGLYLFKSHMYIYYPTSNYWNSTYVFFTVNGSYTTRRPCDSVGRMRLNGLRGDYGHDTDICEIIYLTAGDYVQSAATGNTTQGYAQYSCWSGAYLSN